MHSCILCVTSESPSTHLHSLVPELHSERITDPHHCCLGGTVDTSEGYRGEACEGPDVDDATSTLMHHVGGHGLRCGNTVILCLGSEVLHVFSLCVVWLGRPVCSGEADWALW